MNPQQVKYRDVEDLICHLKADELQLTQFFRNAILQQFPSLKEKLSYNVPSYYQKKKLFYVWPASIPWGGVSKGISIGFVNGHLLKDETHFLEKRDRKKVRSKEFEIMPTEDEYLMIFDFIHQAIRIDSSK